MLDLNWRFLFDFIEWANKGVELAWYDAGGLLLGCVVAGMALGFPVAITFMLTNILGIFLFSGGWPVLPQIADNATNLITSFTLSPIPMFILMGSMFFHTGLAL